jgi:hypothetical protein
MTYKEVFWMACDSIEQLRAEYGPFHSRDEAEVEARKLGFGYLLRYEHMIDANDEIQDVRCIFLELPGSNVASKPSINLHTRWADIHEFEHSRHRVRLFEHTRGEGLKEIGDWRR